ncbi:hypothetical protein L5515_009040 [Caenorhabditis briggsae]|uniref:Uncharacterized protein n=1 Tax=Caenorhabditis briggsae TaxID=6238 RepID=A0AAE9F8Y6_CAEBR|nr:hypothetical protein L5515_009040 [Caenorhabditis briggsae]
MPNSSRTLDECGPIRPFLILFSVAGIFGPPIVAVRHSDLRWIRIRRLLGELHLPLCCSVWSSETKPAGSLGYWKASGKSSYKDYPWYPMPETKGMKTIHAETDFRSGVKVGVIAQVFLLSIATFFYVEYHLIQKLTQQIEQNNNQQDTEILAEKC